MYCTVLYWYWYYTVLYWYWYWYCTVLVLYCTVTVLVLVLYCTVLVLYFFFSSLYYIPLYLTDMEQVSNLMQHIKHLSCHRSITMRIDTIQTYDISIQMRVQVAK